jgi:transglutaminase-like putative cysteine protease
MRFARIHKTSSYLMAATGFAAAYFGGEIHLLIGVIFALALVLSWFWEAPRIETETWTRWWNAATLAAFAYTVVDIALAGDPILAGFGFLSFLQVNKLCNRRSSKDYLQMYVLSFLMLTAATTMNTELNYGAWFVLYLVFTTWTLILFHLKREMEDNYLLKHSEDASRSRKVEIDRILNSRRIVGVPFLAATSLISLAAFVMSVGVFFLFPRVGFGLFFANRRAGQNVAGFSERVELGDFGVIKDNPAVVMRVSVDEDQRERVGRDARWRGATYDTYDGRSWKRSSRRTRSLWKWDGKFFVPPVPHDWEERAIKQVIYLEPLDSQLLFGLQRASVVQIHDGPRELPQGAVHEVRTNEYRDILLTISSTLQGTRMNRWTDPDRFVSNPAVKYSVWSDPEPPSLEAMAAAGDALPEDLRAAAAPYLQLPTALEGRVQALAEQVTAGHRTMLDKARAIESHLRTAYKYTTTLGRDEALAPLEDFLFVQRKGHCEYFATSMAVMLRTLGVPARYVSGFYGGQWNPYGDYIAVAHGDAHSWVEVFFNGVGWVPFDPTPPGTGVSGLRTGPYWTMMMWLDSMRMKWYRYVVEYDLNKQFYAVDRLRNWLPRTLGLGDESTGLGSLPKRLSSDRKVQSVGALLLVLAALLIGWSLNRRRRRRRRATHGPRGSAREAGVQLYLLLLKAMQRRGYIKRPSETALEFLETLEARAAPGEVSVAVEVTGRYLEARFGDVPLAPEETAQLTGLIRAMPEEGPSSSHP